MLYELAHTIQKNAPWIWEGVEGLNTLLFRLRVEKRRLRLADCCPEGVRVADERDAAALAEFFKRQPDEAFRWFKPHAFDEETLRKLLRKDTYIIYIEEMDGAIAGYAFLRCFFHGRCFLGKMVDVNHQGRGICTRLCAVGMEMAEVLGLRMFESINKENVGSMRASEKACDVVVVEELENGDVLIEDYKKGSLKRKE